MYWKHAEKNQESLRQEKKSMRNQESSVVCYLAHFSRSKNSWSVMPVLSITLVFYVEQLFSKILEQFQVVVSVVLNRRQYGECPSLQGIMQRAWAGVPLQVPSLSRKQLCYHICRDPSAPDVCYESFQNTYQTSDPTYFNRNRCLLSPGTNPDIGLSRSLRLGKFSSSSEEHRGL